MTNKIKYSIYVIILLFLYLLCRAYIKIEVSNSTNKISDSYEQKIADMKVKVEKDKIELEKTLKQEVLSSKTELEKCKLEIQTEKKKKEYRELSKKNPKEFKKVVNNTLGVKEKKK